MSLLSSQTIKIRDIQELQGLGGKELYLSTQDGGFSLPMTLVTDIDGLLGSKGSFINVQFIDNQPYKVIIGEASVFENSDLLDIGARRVETARAQAGQGMANRLADMMNPDGVQTGGVVESMRAVPGRFGASYLLEYSSGESRGSITIPGTALVDGKPISESFAACVAGQPLLLSVNASDRTFKFANIGANVITRGV